MEVERLRTLVDSMGDDGNPTDALFAAAEARKELDRTEAALVRRARLQGMTWEMIAVSLGVSKQAVHKRYGRV